MMFITEVTSTTAFQKSLVYLDIVKKFPNCCFWFIQGLNNSVTNIFKERISKIFEIEGFDFKEYFS